MDQPRGQRVTWPSDFLWGSQELYWLYFYQYINKELAGNTYTGPIEETIKLCEQVGWFWPHKGFIVITEKPTIYKSSDNRLHSEKGPALEYSDGYSLYSLNGVRMTGVEHLVDNPVPKDILNVKNTEQRAELIKLYGIDKLFWKLQPKNLDNQGEYSLYSVSIYEDIPRIYLKMNNPSVDEVHIEAVHPDCRTVSQALNWRNMGTVDLPESGFISPVILT